eukprot:TRINITY_DN1084_c6_g1_i1.p1 TRINITY_DN1084_c6_g1~~TRINITY_DN1084_c6_g1_i1.p1  ORF type:complete len:624 (-),score=197.73 TRINITY_DN1084_c6_g1_i1:109-1980(-)
MSTVEAQYFSQLYQIADEDKDGVVGQRDAFNFFQKSGLPKEILAQIWNQVNPNNVQLTPPQFAMAMRLISCAQNGKPVTIQEASASQIPLPKFQNVPYPQPEQPQQQAQNKPKEFSWSSPPDVIQKFASLFNATDSDRDGFINGQQALQIFSASGVPNNTLAHVWELADGDRDGRLDVKEFCLAMYVISAIKAGQQIPSPLPPVLLSSIISALGGSPQQSVQPTQQQQQQQPPPQPVQQQYQPMQQPVASPPQSGWAITSEDASSINQIFTSLDDTNVGVLDGQKLRNFFVQSGLPNNDLATIFTLSDLNRDGQLDRTEFGIAMKLIKVRKSGGELPSSLPAELLSSIGLGSSQPSDVPTGKSAITDTNQLLTLTPSLTQKSTKPPSQEANRVVELEQKLAALTEQYQRNESYNSSLRGQLNTANREKTKYETNWKTIVKEKKDIDFEVRELKYKCNRTEDKLKEAEGKLMRAEARLGISKSGQDPVAELNSLLNAKDREIAELLEKLKSSDTRLSNRLKSNEDRIKEIQKQIEEASKPERRKSINKASDQADVVTSLPEPTTTTTTSTDESLHSTTQDNPFLNDDNSNSNHVTTETSSSIFEVWSPPTTSQSFDSLPPRESE